MSKRDELLSSASDLLDDLLQAATQAVDDAQRFLASPQGRRLREGVAMGLISLAPVIARVPIVRASKVTRLVGVAGGAALIAKLGEAIRDWEPSSGPRS